jgi:hypothetical protein
MSISVMRLHNKVWKTEKHKPTEMVSGKTCQVTWWEQNNDKCCLDHELEHNNGDIHVSVMRSMSINHNEIKCELRLPLAAALDCCAQKEDGIYEAWFPLIPVNSHAANDFNMYSQRDNQSSASASASANASTNAPPSTSGHESKASFGDSGFSAATEPSLNKATSATESPHRLKNLPCVLLRIEWKPTKPKEDELINAYMLLSLSHISISLVDSEKRRELLCMHLSGLDFRCSDSDSERRALVEIESFQVDNQQSVHSSEQQYDPAKHSNGKHKHTSQTSADSHAQKVPVFLAPRLNSDKHCISSWGGQQPVFQVAIFQNNHKSNSQLSHFEYVALLLQELDLRLEHHAVLRIYEFGKRIGEKLASTGGPTDENDLIAELNGGQDELQSDAEAMASISDRVGTNWKLYIAELFLHPMKINLSYYKNVQNTKSSNDQEQEKVKTNSNNIVSLATFYNVIQPFFVNLTASLEDAPLQLNGFKAPHLFVSQGKLVKDVSKFYLMEAARQIFFIFGSFDVIGNPVGLLQNVGHGVRDFFYEPKEAFLKLTRDDLKRSEKAKGLGKGLMKGTLSLVGHTTIGVFNAASRLTQSVGTAIAHLSTDDEYLQRRAHYNVNAEGGLLGTKKRLGHDVAGITDGIKGLVMLPAQGLRDNGLKGMAKGMAKGITGVVVKPTAGMLDMATHAMEAVRDTAGNLVASHTTKRAQRKRLVQIFSQDGRLLLYNPIGSQGQAMLLLFSHKEDGSFAAQADHAVRRRSFTNSGFGRLSMTDLLKEDGHTTDNSVEPLASEEAAAPPVKKMGLSRKTKVSFGSYRTLARSGSLKRSRSAPLEEAETEQEEQEEKVEEVERPCSPPGTRFANQPREQWSHAISAISNTVDHIGGENLVYACMLGGPSGACLAVLSTARLLCVEFDGGTLKGPRKKWVIGLHELEYYRLEQREFGKGFSLAIVSKHNTITSPAGAGEKRRGGATFPPQSPHTPHLQHVSKVAELIAHAEEDGRKLTIEGGSQDQATLLVLYNQMCVLKGLPKRMVGCRDLYCRQEVQRGVRLTAMHEHTQHALSRLPWKHRAGDGDWECSKSTKSAVSVGLSQRSGSRLNMMANKPAFNPDGKLSGRRRPNTAENRLQVKELEGEVLQSPVFTGFMKQWHRRASLVVSTRNNQIDEGGAGGVAARQHWSTAINAVVGGLNVSAAEADPSTRSRSETQESELGKYRFPSIRSRSESASSFKKTSYRHSLTTRPVLVEGELEKKATNLLGQWQRRHFALQGHYLNYYSCEDKGGMSAESLKGSLDLQTDIDRAAIKDGRQFFLSIKGEEVVSLRAATAKSAQKWVGKINDFLTFVAALRRVPLFQKLLKNEVQMIVYHAEARFYTADAVIVRQGAEINESSKFYIIVEGRVRVIVNGRFVRYKEVHDFFGERGLIEVEPRTADVIADTDTRLMCVSRLVFNEYLSKQESVQQEVAELKRGDTVKAESREMSMLVSRRGSAWGQMDGAEDAFNDLWQGQEEEEAEEAEEAEEKLGEEKEEEKEDEEEEEEEEEALLDESTDEADDGGDYETATENEKWTDDEDQDTDGEEQSKPSEEAFPATTQGLEEELALTDGHGDIGHDETEDDEGGYTTDSADNELSNTDGSEWEEEKEEDADDEEEEEEEDEEKKDDESDDDTRTDRLSSRAALLASVYTTSRQQHEHENHEKERLESEQQRREEREEAERKALSASRNGISGSGSGGGGSKVWKRTPKKMIGGCLPLPPARSPVRGAKKREKGSSQQ